jgi:hypothetical protein
MPVKLLVVQLLRHQWVCPASSSNSSSSGSLPSASAEQLQLPLPQQWEEVPSRHL